MKKEELVSRIQNYMNVQQEYQHSVRNAEGRKRFAVLDFFANNIGGRAFSASMLGVIGLLVAAPLGIFAIIPMVAATVLGFFVPKLVEKINLKLMNRFGKKYTKQYLGSKENVWYAYNLICQGNLVNAKSSDEISNQDLQKFCKDVETAHRCYDRELKEVVSDKIAKRNKRDFNKITKLLNKYGYADENAKAKVEKILENNEKVLSPWYELHNEAGEFASKLADCAEEFNPGMKLTNKNLYRADTNHLRKKVNDYIKSNDLAPVEFDALSLFEDTKEKQNYVKYYSNTEEKENEEIENFDKKLYN